MTRPSEVADLESPPMEKSRTPDLARVTDCGSLLRRHSAYEIRQSIAEYIRVLYYVQQFRRAKWTLFALFMTLCIEFQIRAFFPKDLEAQAMLALIIALIVLAVVCILEHLALLTAGDPGLILPDEEAAVMKRNILEMTKQAMPQSMAGRMDMNNLFEKKKQAVSGKSPATTSPPPAVVSPRSETPPLARVSTVTPRGLAHVPQPIAPPPHPPSAILQKQQQQHHGGPALRSDIFWGAAKEKGAV